MTDLDSFCEMLDKAKIEYKKDDSCLLTPSYITIQVTMSGGMISPDGLITEFFFNKTTKNLTYIAPCD